MQLKVIARIHSDFPTKFGIPRQSGLIEQIHSTIVFEPEYRNDDALRGLEDFSHIWLIWGFSENTRDNWSPTVRPPRLGGNERKGVFATRSSFRPNALGLSSVRLIKIEHTKQDGTILQVSGVDMMDGTPIYDIKPYLSLTDCHTDATEGFARNVKDYALKVIISEELQSQFPEKLIEILREIIAQDPRPSYQNDPSRVYGFQYSGYEIKFTVDHNIATVKDIISSY